MKIILLLSVSFDTDESCDRLYSLGALIPLPTDTLALMGGASVASSLRMDEMSTSQTRASAPCDSSLGGGSCDMSSGGGDGPNHSLVDMFPKRDLRYVGG